MIQKQSRRDLLRLVEQGKEAQRYLAAAVLHAGGTIDVPRSVILAVTARTRINVYSLGHGVTRIEVQGYERPASTTENRTG